MTPSVGGSSAAQWRTIRQWIPVTIILASVFLERLAFYGVISNLVFFLSSAPYQWTPLDASLAVFLYYSVSFMMPLFAGWLSDTFFGKFWTIVLGYVFMLSGYVFIPLMYLPGVKHSPKKPFSLCITVSNVTKYGKDVTHTRFYYQETCSTIMSLALTAVAFGSACLRAVISPFGAIQVESRPAYLQRFFPAFFWVVNIGALGAFGVLAYLQQNVNMFYSYIGAYCCLGLSAILFLIGTPLYLTDWPLGSPLNEVFSVIWEALRIWCQRSPCLPGCQESVQVNNQINSTNTNSNSTLINNYNEEDQDDSSLMETRVDISAPKIPFLDRAKESHGGTHSREAVDHTRIFLKTSLLFLSLLIYWLLYVQMHSTFLIQGLHMKVNISLNMKMNIKFQIPVAWLMMFEVTTVLFAVPFFSWIFSRFSARGYPVSPHFRIGLGMAFAMLGMASAGCVEIWRVYRINEGNGSIIQNISGKVYNASTLPIAFQIPQYVFLGCSDTLVTVAALECAFVQAPRSLQSIVTGLLWFSSGISGLVGMVLMEASDTIIFSHNSGNGFINSGKYTFAKYFFFLVIAQAFALALFVFIVRWLLPRWDASVSSPPTPTPTPTSVPGVYDPDSTEPPLIE